MKFLTLCLVRTSYYIFIFQLVHNRPKLCFLLCSFAFSNLKIYPESGHYSTTSIVISYILSLLFFSGFSNNSKSDPIKINRYVTPLLKFLTLLLLPISYGVIHSSLSPSLPLRQHHHISISQPSPSPSVPVELY